ncbi:MAG: hypothetical protein ACJAZO_004967 [Myxococcota bacterium]
MITLLLALAAAEPLPLGQAVVSDIAEGPRSFTIDITEPGILSVAVRAHDELDLVIDVLDEDGQPVQNGHADDDIGDDRGAEQLASSLPWVGTYTVRVSELRKLGGGSFHLSASFAPMPSVALPDLPYRRPSRALVVARQQTESATLNSNEDATFHWLRVDPDVNGTLVVSLTADHGDLVLEQFLESDFTEPTEVSDQDREGRLANEQLSVKGKVGTPLWFRVRDRDDAGELTYKVTVD